MMDSLHHHPNPPLENLAVLSSVEHIEPPLQLHAQLSLSEAVALLEHSRMLSGKPDMQETESNVSAPFCRICRGGSDKGELIQCPCKCKGTMGFVHEVCLQKWHVIRKAKVCEICHEAYEFPDGLPEPDFHMKMSTFFQPECFGRIMKCLLNFGALSYLSYLNSQQLQNLIDVMKDGPTSPLLVIYLMFSGVSNFTYFEWTMHNFNRIHSILDYWWNRTSRIAPGVFSDLLSEIEMTDEISWTFIPNVV